MPSRTRASAWEWAQVTLLAGNLAWTTMCLGGFRPETMEVTSAVNGALLAVHLLERVLAKGAVARSHPAGWLLLPFLVYAAANVAWITPARWLGWRDWLGWAQMIAVFWVVLNGVRSTAPRMVLFGALVAVAGIGVACGVYQEFAHPDWLMLGRTQARQFIGRASGPFGIPNSLAALLLLLLPVTGSLVLRRRASAAMRIFWGYITFVFLLGLVLTISRGAWLSLALVSMLWPVLAARGTLARRLAMAGGIAALVLAVGTILIVKVPPVRARFVSLKADVGELSRPIIWRGAWKIYAAHPVLGGGAGSFDVLFDRYRPAKFQDDPLWAHNDYLNTLSDYGTTGFGLFFGACGVIGVCCWRRARDAPRRDWLDSRTVAGGVVAGMAAFGLQLFVDFHFKIPALAMTFATMSGFAVQRSWRTGETRLNAPVQRTIAGGAAIAVIAATVAFALPIYRAEALRYGARQEINVLAVHQLPVTRWPPVLKGAREKLTRAVAIDPANGAAWSDLAYVIALSAHLEPARSAAIGRQAEQAADRALALSRAMPEFWVRRGVALDLQGRWLEAGGPFVEALKLAPARAMVWYQQAFHLSLNPTESGRALAAVGYCLRLDPGNREGHALQRRLTQAASH